MAVDSIEKAGQAVVATLDNVLRNVGQVEAWLSGLGPMIGAISTLPSSHRARHSVSIYRVVYRKVNLTPFMPFMIIS